jgi:hypothetical protein
VKSTIRVNNFFLVTLWVLVTVAFAGAQAKNSDVTVSCQDLLAARANSDIPHFGKPNGLSAVPKYANLLLDKIPRHEGELFLAMPTYLKTNPNQPQQFGEGQQNAMTYIGEFNEPPYVALIRKSRRGSKVLVQFASWLETKAEVEVSVAGQSKVHPIQRGQFEIEVESADAGNPVFFRPVGWKDWFAVSFINAYAGISGLMGRIPSYLRYLPTGESVVDPLGLGDAKNPFEFIKTLDGKDNLGFQYAEVSDKDRVHGHFVDLDGTTTLTSSGGIRTRYRLEAPFKIVYLAKPGRNLQAEAAEDVVSGTGPHFVGATAEIILNLGKEPLMTFLGVELPKVGPDGNPLAWQYSHLWVGKWLQSGEVFVTPQGNYHWHLNHLTTPVAAQVLTPPNVPSAKNLMGF